MEFWDKDKRAELVVEFEQIVNTFKDSIKELRRNYDKGFDIWVELNLSKESGVMYGTKNEVVQNTAVLDNTDFKIITGP